MSKRRHSSPAMPSVAIAPAPKRQRILDYFSPLSDELLIRILHYLPLPILLRCEVLSHRFRQLSLDSQLWKSLYYNRFVLPRALRIPGIRTAGGEGVDGALVFSDRRSRWLDESALVGQDCETGFKGKHKTNWKARYRLRHNWARGACEVGELFVGGGEQLQRKERDMLVGLAEGLVFTANREEGLRAWDSKGKVLLAKFDWDREVVPTCLAIDDQVTTDGNVGIAIGFENGKWSIWRLNIKMKAFDKLYERLAVGHGNASLSAVAYANPYVLTITDGQLLSLYLTEQPPHLGTTHVAEGAPAGTRPAKETEPTITTSTSFNSSHGIRPKLLTSLRSHTTWPPLSLSIRTTQSTLIASIAYTLPTYFSGFTIGLQELRFSLLPSQSFPTLTLSRLTSAQPQGFQPLSPLSLSPMSSKSRNPFPASSTRPTSMSYSHPYVLATHPDNTLTLYLCNSSAENLSISNGTRLWGHTSGVSSAEITSRGKAVSVSTRGEELRVWELEGGRKLCGRRTEEGCVVVKGSTDSEQLDINDISPGIATSPPSTKMQAKQQWLGFDDEVVIVLKEGTSGTKALVVYDFT